MNLKSKNFEHEGNLPPTYTCDGDEISPHLAWEGFPDGTKSFALTCLDPDAPGGEFAHWLVSNIPVSTRELPENCGCPAGATEVENDYGKTSYGSPCPPSGVHHYIFTVYALDTEKLENLNRQNFVSEVNKHSLDSAELVGLYRRR
ncbi:MAG: YbhB/YbcL family Raf kinase inhibitor-like protein [Patescibacteria group bacterium]|nr:YbhB/YbcL family Raf kinase inhibitor-like protein [Patescibacteria group bacterium]